MAADEYTQDEFDAFGKDVRAEMRKAGLKSFKPHKDDDGKTVIEGVFEPSDAFIESKKNGNSFLGAKFCSQCVLHHSLQERDVPFWEVRSQ